MGAFIDETTRNRVLSAYRRDIAAFVKKYLPPQQRLMNGTPILLDAQADELALAISQKMVVNVLRVNIRAWRSAASSRRQSRQIYEALRAELEGPTGTRARRIAIENARLIRSLPDRIGSRVSTYALQRQIEGARVEQIAMELRDRLPRLSKAKINLLARTETSKAETAITQARSEQIGIRWYEWSSNHDERVRKSHRYMDGVLVNWNDAPAPEDLVKVESSLGHYHAGNCPNCRCTALPLVDVDEVSWPHRVYAEGRVRRITLAQFRKTYLPAVAA